MRSPVARHSMIFPMTCWRCQPTARSASTNTARCLSPLGKSYLKSFKLPTSDTTYRLAIRSYVVFDGLQIGPNAAMFFPLVTFLDEEKKPLGTSSRGNLRYIPSTLFDEPNSPPKLEFAILVKPDSRIRYVVVHTSRDLIEFGGLAIAALPRIAANSAPIIVPVPSGPDGPRQVPGSPFGDLRILLQPPRT